MEPWCEFASFWSLHVRLLKGHVLDILLPLQVTQDIVHELNVLRVRDGAIVVLIHRRKQGVNFLGPELKLTRAKGHESGKDDT